MKASRSHGRPQNALTTGTVVLVPVPGVDRHKTDVKHVPGVVVEITDGFFYRVGVVGGILSDCYLSNNLIIEENVQPETYGLENIASTWRGLKKISVREALANISPTGGQGFTRCGCKGACDTLSCKCKKANLLCNSRCHAGSATCKNCSAQSL